MKKVYVGIITLLIYSKSSRAQMPVYDERNTYQRERMVFVRWNKFKPDGLFSQAYWILHPGYKGKDKRPLGPKGPYLFHEALLQGQDNQDEQYRKYTDTIANKHLAEDLNSEGGALDVPYSFYYEDRFKKLQQAKDNVLAAQAPDVQLYLLKNKLLDWYNTERDILDDRISNIHNSYMDRGSRILAYQRIETDYTKLTDSFTKVVMLAKNTVHAPVKSDTYKTIPLKDDKKLAKTDQMVADEILRYYKF